MMFFIHLAWRGWMYVVVVQGQPVSCPWMAQVITRYALISWKWRDFHQNSFSNIHIKYIENGSFQKTNLFVKSQEKFICSSKELWKDYLDLEIGWNTVCQSLSRQLTSGANRTRNRWLEPNRRLTLLHTSSTWCCWTHL